MVWLRGAVLLVVMVTTIASAETVDEVRRIHLEAMGGRARVHELAAVRATGRTRLGDRELTVTLWAQRPNRIRIETVLNGALITQAWDGEGEPWQRDSRSGRVHALGPAEAAAFRQDAAFDDVLVRTPEPSTVIEYAGREVDEGRECIKLLVTEGFVQQSVVYLAADTYLITRLDRTRPGAGGGRAWETVRHSWFRPVQGVILPHRIRMERDGRLQHETVLEQIEANPLLPPGWFSRPPESAER